MPAKKLLIDGGGCSRPIHNLLIISIVVMSEEVMICKLRAAGPMPVRGRRSACVYAPVVISVLGGSRCVQLSLHEVPNLVKMHECQLVLPSRRLRRELPLFCLFTVQATRVSRDKLQGADVELEKDQLLDFYLRLAELFQRLLVEEISQPLAEAAESAADAAAGGSSEREERVFSEEFWVDALDPASGMPVDGQLGCASWNELDAGSLFLGYAPGKSGCCGQLSHPVWGTAIYPASVFVAAPQELLVRVMQKLERELPELASEHHPPEV